LREVIAATPTAFVGCARCSPA